MGEVAASRRARSRFGDFAFNLLAAGLALALLFATGRHLFAPSVDLPQQTLAPVAVSVVVEPAPRGIVPVRTPVKGSSAVTGSHGYRAASSGKAATTLGKRERPIGGRRADAPRAFLGSAALPKTAPKPAAPRRAAIRAAELLQAAHSSLIAVQRMHPSVAMRNAARPQAKPRAKTIAGTATAAGAARPRETSPSRVARLAPIRSRPARRPTSDGRQRSSVTAAPRQIGARGVGDLKRIRAGRRPSAARAPSIIEPPLGYDAQPALVIAPGAAQLDLGESAWPTIRSRRRH